MTRIVIGQVFFLLKLVLTWFAPIFYYTVGFFLVIFCVYSIFQPQRSVTNESFIFISFVFLYVITVNKALI